MLKLLTYVIVRKQKKPHRRWLGALETWYNLSSLKVEGK